MQRIHITIKKLNALIETYQLTEYDQEKKKPVVTNLAEEKKPSFDKEAVKEQLKKRSSRLRSKQRRFSRHH